MYVCVGVCVVSTYLCGYRQCWRLYNKLLTRLSKRAPDLVSRVNRFTYTTSILTENVAKNSIIAKNGEYRKGGGSLCQLRRWRETRRGCKPWVRCWFMRYGRRAFLLFQVVPPRCEYENQPESRLVIMRCIYRRLKAVGEHKDEVHLRPVAQQAVRASNGLCGSDLLSVKKRWRFSTVQYYTLGIIYGRCHRKPSWLQKRMVSIAIFSII